MSARARHLDDGPRWMVLPAVVGIIWVVVLCMRQAVWDVPVPTKPLPGDRVSAAPLDLLWSAPPGETAGARVQVATDRGFKNLLLDQRCDACNNLRLSVRAPAGQRCYWRVQRVRPDGAGAWTRPIAFQVED